MFNSTITVVPKHGAAVMYTHVVNDIATGVVYKRNWSWVYINLKSLTVTDTDWNRNDLFERIHSKHIIKHLEKTE